MAKIRRQLVQFDPRPELETVFGRYPRLDDGASRALGLREDSAEALVRLPSETSTWARTHE